MWLNDGRGSLPRILFGATVSALVFHHTVYTYFGFEETSGQRNGRSLSPTEIRIDESLILTSDSQTTGHT
jgi:hypothetical protein